MKLLIVLFLMAIFVTSAFAQFHYVRPHYRRDGTFVQGYIRTNPDGNPNNNRDSILGY